MGWEGQTAGIADANEKTAAITAAVAGIVRHRRGMPQGRPAGRYRELRRHRHLLDHGRAAGRDRDPGRRRRVLRRALPQGFRRRAPLRADRDDDGDQPADAEPDHLRCRQEDHEQRRRRCPSRSASARCARRASRPSTAWSSSRQPNDTLRVGDRLEWIVGYSDTTVHLHDEIHATRKGRIEAVWPIVGRGKIRNA